MKKYKNADLGLLLLRCAVGIVFVAHGLQKFWALDGTIAFFGALGLPAFFAYVIATIEFLGGLSLILGVFSDIAGYLLAIQMVFAIYLVKLSKGLIGGYELDMTLLAAALSIAMIGPGRYVFYKRNK